MHFWQRTTLLPALAVSVLEGFLATYTITASCTVANMSAGWVLIGMASAVNELLG